MVAEVPEEFVTVIWTVPVPPGDVAVIEVPSLATITFVAGVVPKLTVDPCANPKPDMATFVPPVAGPSDGVVLERTGTNANCPTTTELPPAGVTVTFTVPVPPGAVTTTEVPAELMLVIVAADPPKETVEPVVNPAPVMVTVVPPVAGPDVGEREVMVGR